MSIPNYYSPLLYASSFAQTQSQPESPFDNWEVFLEDQIRVGKVDGYLYDPDTSRISYVCIKLNDEFYTREIESHILFPREEIIVNEKKQQLTLAVLTAEFLPLYPKYEIGKLIDQPLRKRIRQFFTSGYTTDVTHHGLTTMPRTKPGVNRVDRQAF